MKRKPMRMRQLAVVVVIAAAVFQPVFQTSPILIFLSSIVGLILWEFYLRQCEKAVRADIFSAVFDLYQGSVIILSPSLKVLKVNAASNVLYGPDVVGKRVYELVKEGDLLKVSSQLDELVQDSVDTYRVINFCRKMIDPTASQCAQTEASFHMFHDFENKNDFRIIMISRVKDELKDDRTDSLCIDVESEVACITENTQKLHSPLRHLQGALRALSDGSPQTNFEKEARLNEATASIEIMKSIVNQTTDFSAACRREELEPKKSRVYLSAVLERVHQITYCYFKATPQMNNLTDDKLMLWTDEEWLFQMLLTLVINAFQRSADIHMNVSISNKSVIFEVCDAVEGQESTPSCLHGLQMRAERLGGSFGRRSNQDMNKGNIYWFSVQFESPPLAYVQRTSFGKYQRQFSMENIKEKGFEYVQTLIDSCTSIMLQTDSYGSLNSSKNWSQSSLKSQQSGDRRQLPTMAMLEDMRDIGSRVGSFWGAPASSISRSSVCSNHFKGQQTNKAGCGVPLSSSVSAASERPRERRSAHDKLSNLACRPDSNLELTSEVRDSTLSKPLPPSVEVSTDGEECTTKQSPPAKTAQVSLEYRKRLADERLSAIVIKGDESNHTLQKQLTHLGFKSVRCYVNEARALRRLKTLAVDLVIVDIQMSKELVYRLREFEEEKLANNEILHTQYIAAIVPTFTNAVEDGLISEGYDAVYPKPVSLSDVVEISNDYLAVKKNRGIPERVQSEGSQDLDAFETAIMQATEHYHSSQHSLRHSQSHTSAYLRPNNHSYESDSVRTSISTITAHTTGSFCRGSFLHRPRNVVILQGEGGQKNLQDSLRSSDFETIMCFRDGAKAVEAMRDDSICLVIADLHMNECDAREVIADYRASEDRAIPLQIVALTALYTNGLEDELIALGFNAVYPKPISPADIDDIVSELLLY